MPDYYEFIKNMWVMQRITSEQVQGFVPKFITQEQANEILAMAQVNAAR